MLEQGKKEGVAQRQKLLRAKKDMKLWRAMKINILKTHIIWKQKKCTPNAS